MKGKTSITYWKQKIIAQFDIFDALNGPFSDFESVLTSQEVHNFLVQSRKFDALQADPKHVSPSHRDPSLTSESES